jgi:hypothetical protein
MPKVLLLVAAACALCTLLLLNTFAAAPTDAQTQGVFLASPALALSVRGNEIIDGAGRHIVLHGIAHSGSEYMCSGNNVTFEGMTNTTASMDSMIASMAAWNINTIRVPLNASCWLGTHNNVESATQYKADIQAYVQRIAAAGLYVVIGLHCNVTCGQGGTAAESFADPTALTFWTSIANTFKDQPYVLFDLFNEPHGVDWNTWLNGSGNYTGMQQMVDAVRSAGAHNVVMATGTGGYTGEPAGDFGWGNDLTGWLSHEPVDPDNQLVAGWHSYNFNSCNNIACWDTQISPVIAHVPLVASEIGENNCTNSYTPSLMTWLDGAQQSYINWAWNTWDCSGGPALISSYNGTPTNYGLGVKQHLLGVGCVLSSPTSTVVPTATATATVPPLFPTPTKTPKPIPPVATPTQTPPPATPTPTPVKCDVHSYDTATEHITIQICPLS